MIKVLHVEDDADIREIAQMSLEFDGGFQLKQAHNGHDALDVLESFVPDIFLLDVMMPMMSGEELLARLREMPECANIPVVFMTARVQPDEIDALKRQGAEGVIMKPFDPMELGGQLRNFAAKAAA